ncbi:MAG: MotA/TolQ/ExbB proton channel family protein [Opitutales bacterium]|nr:MotA/TolQ/ExbB proton channel family protein [Opitutales bacterium]
MWTLLQQAGIFAWPLALCSAVAVFVIAERLFALRSNNVIPQVYLDRFVQGEVPNEGDQSTVAGRIVAFFYSHDVDAEQLKAFARLQISRMERGFFVLEIVVSAAPLIGLLGTVTGLVKVFSQISPDSGLPDTAAFIEGVALALSTTMIGLAIAIPTLVALGYLTRRIDIYAAQLGVGVERLIALKGKTDRRSR